MKLNKNWLTLIKMRLRLSKIIRGAPISIIDAIIDICNKEKKRQREDKVKNGK